MCNTGVSHSCSEICMECKSVQRMCSAVACLLGHGAQERMECDIYHRITFRTSFPDQSCSGLGQDSAVQRTRLEMFIAHKSA